MVHRPLRLRLSRQALADNWRFFAARGGVETGAAIKADGYGLGARAVLDTLYAAGARDFFVATWSEAAALGELPEGARLAVLHGLGPDDGQAASASPARPVLCSLGQVRRWRAAFGERPCDVMVDSGMNRLGVGGDELDALEGLDIDTLHSHLACADDPAHPLNAAQRERFAAARARVRARRYSLANSAGILLGPDYAFDLTRPGIGLYGGAPAPGAEAFLSPVVTVETQVLQRRVVRAGEAIGYGATFVAERDTPVAILNIGYADGYPRNMSGQGHARWGGTLLPLLGRVSMDLVAADVTRADEVREGDWLGLDFDVDAIARASGISAYEVLTGLGSRFARDWTD
ncbi:alanine racemase [Sphingomicrobium astaxanthinifaciens]|uniref:alanine racemase n=1 Tax=Sphingomicrobium astaxanthinifaciens TaxID=1227949 RepID=UPI001FCAE03F|nr:alanine racemase [Sphingomicrobium astaxanthinifaciens]MCJ7421972.1 alanine racemase [Sphingomicrobium astaxanthinifaciens]